MESQFSNLHLHVPSVIFNIKLGEETHFSPGVLNDLFLAKGEILFTGICKAFGRSLGTQRAA